MKVTLVHSAGICLGESLVESLSGRVMRTIKKLVLWTHLFCLMNHGHLIVMYALLVYLIHLHSESVQIVQVLQKKRETFA